MRGWMWGGSEEVSDGTLNGNETGVGWISMNSLNCDADEDGQSDGASDCPSLGVTVANYGVDVPDENGILSGYAWSENLGWITFNAADLGGCPNSPCNARRESDTEIRGWARIVSIDTAGSNAGGYEGWIKLGSESGDSISYGGTISGSGPADITGYAWADDEFGWIRYEDVQYNDTNLHLAVCPPTGIITQGGSFQLLAYYNASSNVVCSDLTGATDVTASATWVSDVPAIVTVDDGASKGLVTGVIQGGPIAVRATYLGSEAQGLITVNSTINPDCGNGVIDGSEECDDGAAGNGSCGAGLTCSPYCITNICVGQCIGGP